MTSEALTFRSLSPATVRLSTQLICDQADFLFRLWPDGQIAKAVFGERIVAQADPDEIAGRPVTDIVDASDAPAVDKIVSDAVRGRDAYPVVVRHSDLICPGTSARYSAHLSSDSKNLLLIGNALSPELSSDRQAAHSEILRLDEQSRHVSETKYRLLFEAAPEGLLVVDAAGGRIEEANGNALTHLSLPRERVIGEALHRLVDDAEDLPALLQGDPSFAGPGPLVRVVRAKKSNLLLRLSCQAIRTAERATLVIRLSRVEEDGDAAEMAPVTELLRKTPVPLLLSDHRGTATWANGAFAALVPDRTVIGEPVSEIMGLSSSSLNIALAQAAKSDRILTSLGALDSRMTIANDAHVTIVSVRSDPAEYWFLIWMARGDPANPEDQAQGLLDLVGEAPMRTLVRRSTEALERSCIETALKLTGNNRAAAAGVLGLSRQSLYTKMRKHDLN